MAGIGLGLAGLDGSAPAGSNQSDDDDDGDDSSQGSGTQASSAADLGYICVKWEGMEIWAKPNQHISTLINMMHKWKLLTSTGLFSGVEIDAAVLLPKPVPYTHRTPPTDQTVHSIVCVGRR